MSGKNARAVIWDLDGVIADTAPFHFQAWRELAQELGQDFSEEDFRHVFGMRNVDIIRTVLAPDMPDDEMRALAEKKDENYRARVSQHIKPLPGVLPLLHSLKRQEFKLALVSSTSPGNMKLVLSSLGVVRLFDCLVSGQDVSRGKPDAEGFLLAASKLRVAPESCVVIEDAINGIRAARAAGMKCIAVANTHPRQSLAEADLAVDSLAGLTAEQIELLLQ